MSPETDLNPDDFGDTAEAVMAVCGRKQTVEARARLLAEAGLLGVLARETAGGMGLPLDFAVPVLKAAGSGLLAYPLLEALLLSRAFGGDGAELVAAIVRGEMRPTIAWSGEMVGNSGPVGRAPHGASATHVLAFREDGSAILLDANLTGVKGRADMTLDLECPEVMFDIRQVSEGAALPAVAVDRLRRDGLLMRAAVILGHAETCLNLAAAYAQQRRQFGRALSANQAIRHRLARQSLAVESIRNAIARALRPDCPDREMAIWAAFAGACDLGANVVEGAIQIFGGMGFTWDVPLHRHLRRIKALAAQGNVAAVGDVVAARLTRTNGTDRGLRHAV